MDEDFIREQIELLAASRGPDRRKAIGRIVAAYWPGGPADRVDPSALRWLRLWRPATAGARLPVCTCAAGHCSVCN